MTVSIDQDKCILCRQCTELCPAVFQYEGRFGTMEVAVKTVPSEFEKNVRQSAGNCPAQAISIR